MSGLATLLKKLGSENGVEIDADELEAIGLSDDDTTEDGPVQDDVLSISIPGRAAGMVELWLGADTTAKADGVESDGLMWYPIIREGQWALRPGGSGTKKRMPLKVVAGSSKNQRKEIGLADLKAAFDDEAIEHVTVPETHSNTTLENTGFIKGMKVVDGVVKDQKTKKSSKVKVLLGGYDIKLPEVKRKMQLGSVAGRSAGILYDYTNTETGKTYPAVVEHVCLTNKPWITGMLSFGRKLAEGGMNVVGLSLSDEGPSDDEYTLALADELELSEDDQDFLAVAGATWDHETSPAWLQGQVNKILQEARQKKQEAKRAQASKNGAGYSPYVEESVPRYRCCEAKPGSALVSDGYGDEANYWIAPITVAKGVVSLSDFDKWTASKRTFMPDERDAPTKENLSLNQEDKPDDAPAPSRIELAQAAHRARGAGTNDQPPRGGGNMGSNDGSSTTLELSEVAQAAIQRAETEAREQKERADRLERQIAGLSSTVFSNEADKFISWVASDESGLGLSEKRGFSGFLVELRHTLLADDGEPAVVSDHFADASNSEGTLTLSDVVKRLFNAISTSQKGKKSLGEQLFQPSEEQEVELGADGKPVADGSDGKPAVSLNEKEAEEELADSEKNQETLLSEIDPRVLKHMGLEIPDAADKLVKKEASIKKEYAAGATLADLAKKNSVAISNIKDLLKEAGVTIRPTTTGKVGAS